MAEQEWVTSVVLPVSLRLFAVAKPAVEQTVAAEVPAAEQPVAEQPAAEPSVVEPCNAHVKRLHMIWMLKPTKPGAASLLGV